MISPFRNELFDINRIARYNIAMPPCLEISMTQKYENLAVGLRITLNSNVSIYLLTISKSICFRWQLPDTTVWFAANFDVVTLSPSLKAAEPEMKPVTEPSLCCLNLLMTGTPAGRLALALALELNRRRVQWGSHWGVWLWWMICNRVFGMARGPYDESTIRKPGGYSLQ